MFATQLCRLACFTCWFPCSQRTCRHPFSRRRLLSKRMDERETDCNGQKRRSIPMLGKGEAQDSWCSCESQFLFPSHARLPVVPGVFLRINSVGRCASLAATTFVGMLPHGHALLPSTVRLTDRFSGSQVSAAWMSVYRKETIEQKNARSWHGNTSDTSVAVGRGRGVGEKDETTKLGFSATNDASTTVLQGRYLLHELVFACSDFLPGPCVSFNLFTKQSCPQGSCKVRTSFGACHFRYWKVCACFLCNMQTHCDKQPFVHLSPPCACRAIWIISSCAPTDAALAGPNVSSEWAPQTVTANSTEALTKMPWKRKSWLPLLGKIRQYLRLGAGLQLLERGCGRKLLLLCAERIISATTDTGHADLFGWLDLQRNRVA